jgi:type II secretory pathway component PulK
LSLARKPRAGFALLLTVTLLAFLVVLLIGLAAYTRVETAIAGNTQRQTQARQNALVALNIALGQLQTYAGRDQAVTATAEAVTTTNSTKHYTGVWWTDATDPNNNGPLL